MTVEDFKDTTELLIDETWIKFRGIVYHKWRINGGRWHFDPTAYKELPVVYVKLGGRQVAL